jgi:hypothetical protein
MYRLRILSVASVLLPLLLQEARATVITVRQDGTGDYVTISGAVAAASAGDTVEVGPGTYGERIQIGVTLTLQSTQGPESTVLDGENARRLLIFDAGQGTVVSGFKMVDAYTGQRGPAALVRLGASVRISDCVFEGNEAGEEGGAVALRDLGSGLELRDCTFSNNHADLTGGAVAARLAGSLTVSGCSFYQNSCEGVGVVAAITTHAEVQDCLFVGNATDQLTACIRFQSCTGRIENNTFYGNIGGQANAACIVMDLSGGASVYRNIITETSGYGLRYLSSPGFHGCNLFWSNSSGPISGDGLKVDEIIEDPLFCPSGFGDFTISSISPAAPDRSPCDSLIGALPVGCSPPVPGVNVPCPDTVFVEERRETIPLSFEICHSSPQDTVPRCFRWTYSVIGSVPEFTQSDSGSLLVSPGECDTLSVFLDGSNSSSGDTALVTLAVEAPCEDVVHTDTCRTRVIVVEHEVQVSCPDTIFVGAGSDMLDISLTVCNPAARGLSSCYRWRLDSRSDRAGLTNAAEDSLYLAPGECSQATIRLDATNAAAGDTARIDFVAEANCDGPTAVDSCSTVLFLTAPFITLDCPGQTFGNVGADLLAVTFRICNSGPNGGTTCYDWRFESTGSAPGLSDSDSGSVTVPLGECADLEFQIDASEAGVGDTAQARLDVSAPCGSPLASNSCEAVIPFLEPEATVVCSDTALAPAGLGPSRVAYQVCNPAPSGPSRCYHWSYDVSSSVPGLPASGGGTLSLGPGDCSDVFVPLIGNVAQVGDTARVRFRVETPCGDPLAFDSCSTSVLFDTLVCKILDGSAFFYPSQDGRTVYVEPGFDGELLTGFGPANVTGRTDTFCVIAESRGSVNGSYYTPSWNCEEIESGTTFQGRWRRAFPVRWRWGIGTR